MKRKTPILFLVFNRLDTTKQVFEEIRKAKPKQLFIAADGPRTKEEKKKTDAVRKYILENIDWKCEVKKLFGEENLGCQKASVSAINWLFENVEEGIILEDDILPDQSLFRFCQELLEKYKDNEKVMSISGYNGIGSIDVNESYIFVRNFCSWGCAFWKESWKKLDLDLRKYKEIEKKGKLKEYYPNILDRIMTKKRAEQVLKKEVSSWSYPFSIAHTINNAFRIAPKKNLITNLGFQSESTHAKENKWDKRFISQKVEEMKFPLIHSEKIKLNKEYFKKYQNLQIKRIILKKITFS
jgi:hypothetical protein